MKIGRFVSYLVTLYQLHRLFSIKLRVRMIMYGGWGLFWVLFWHLSGVTKEIYNKPGYL